MTKKFSLLILFSGLLSQYLFAQYYLAKTPDASGKYRKTNYSNVRSVSSAENKKTAQMMEAVVDVVKKIYPQPRGAEIGPYGGIFENYRGNSEFRNGPYKISLFIPFFELYTVKSGGIEPSGEYTSSIQIWMNEARYILQVNPVKYGNDLVFRAPRPGIPVSGFPKYNNKLMITADSKRLPWRPATKQEYLENFIVALKASLPGRSYSESEKQMIPNAEQLLASMSPAEKKEIAYLRKWNHDKNLKNGVGEFASTAWGHKWAGFQNPSDTTADQLVIVDENFYDKNLPRYSLQLIVIERQYPRDSYSAAAPSKEMIASNKRITERLNSIVRVKEFSNGLYQLVGKNGIDYVAGNQRTIPEKKVTKYVPGKIDRVKINRMVDSMFRNYKTNLPAVPSYSGSGNTNKADSTVINFPSSNAKKLSLAARKLNTRAELVSYIDELDRKLAGALGAEGAVYSDASSNNMASYGYWLTNNAKPSLFLAIQAAKQQPDNNTLINNLGATLSLCGVDYLAMPLYIVCLKKEPQNSTITNNIGQAWLAMGDQQKAEHYLKQAIGANKYHQHANNTLGLIYTKQGRKDQAIKCFENSLRGSFTLEGYNGLKRLKWESAAKLMNYIKHRYRQPDQISFSKYPIPPQCLKMEETEIRKEQHKAFQKAISDQITRYQKLRTQQKPLADKAHEIIMKRQRERKAIIKPFQPFANAVVSSLQIEFTEKVMKLEKELKEIEMEWTRIKLEYDEAMKQMLDSFEPRLDALGEGNPDLSLDEDICNATTDIVNAYLPQLAEVNEKKFTKIVHAHKDYLNDFLYWIRFAVSTEDQYRLYYYDLVLSVLHILQKVKLTTLATCQVDDAEAKNNGAEFKEADCPLPVGVEIPFVVGKISLDCESWGIEAGEGLVLNIDHKFGAETTIAIGPGLVAHLTPQIGHKSLDLSPGIDAGAKGQFFLTFDGSHVSDGGFLWEAEIDLKGLGKPAEFKQNYTWAVNKGFTSDGPLNYIIDKIYEIPPEQQVNRNIRIFNPN